MLYVQVQAGSGTTWCIAKPSTSQAQLLNIISYCCIEIGLDCSIIQPGGSCYLNDNNKVSDASVVMNLYYNIKGKAPNNCDFDKSGLTITTDPCMHAYSFTKLISLSLSLYIYIYY
ncbi:glucan endo-1 3-beta-d-glucosidase [Phtheirospermum japonicum]|uniref:Glucan endo-1 3-beta-d-glucosidase n=1 Tax=Phtheirospermum japonicum TaxID=374723 RepID=A0A830B7M6_9LAMI|nr:glucan endo-1 3-beta-d-glucosidase [Phtheirospermum japonicum]